MNEVNLKNNEFLERFEIWALDNPLNRRGIYLNLRDARKEFFQGRFFGMNFYGHYLDDFQIFYFGSEERPVLYFVDLEYISSNKFNRICFINCK